MKKVLTLLFAALLALGLVGCKSTPEVEEDKTPPVVDKEEPKEEVLKDKVTLFDTPLEKDVWVTVELNVKGYEKIVIQIDEESQYDVPVNIDNFKFDGVAVEHSGVSGTSYLSEHEFTIGDRNDIGDLINTHQGNIRLHTTHSNEKKPHGITIDVKGLETVSFQYKITTNAYAYIKALKVSQFVVY